MYNTNKVQILNIKSNFWSGGNPEKYIVEYCFQTWINAVFLKILYGVPVSFSFLTICMDLSNSRTTPVAAILKPGCKEFSKQPTLYYLPAFFFVFLIGPGIWTTRWKKIAHDFHFQAFNLFRFCISFYFKGLTEDFRSILILNRSSSQKKLTRHGLIHFRIFYGFNFQVLIFHSVYISMRLKIHNLKQFCMIYQHRKSYWYSLWLIPHCSFQITNIGITFFPVHII